MTFGDRAVTVTGEHALPGWRVSRRFEGASALFKLGLAAYNHDQDARTPSNALQQVGPVMDFISRYISAISLGAILGLSIFNIGYFWKIGLHFIGLIDLSNLVYSAGLALTPIAIVLMVAVYVVPRSIELWKLIVAAIFGGLLSMWGIVNFVPRTLDPKLFDNGKILVGFAISGFAFSAWIFRRYRSTGVMNWRDFGAILFFLYAITFPAGVFTAAVELSDRLTYTVTTKSGDVLSNVQILRSASTGFILAVDGHAVFIPQAEIISVKSVY